jgi:hypothetical protein
MNAIRPPFEHLLQVVFAGVVRGMGLAREDDLHRAPERRENARQAVRVREDQLGAFVAREPSGEPDRQRGRIEQRSG